MTVNVIDRQAHWQTVYRTRAADSFSWYRPHLQTSLELLDIAGLSVDSHLIDIGGGASTLVDDLLDRRLNKVSVLDISARALAIVQYRLGDRGQQVSWIVGDVLQAVLPAGGFGYWHDRAVLHFLTETSDAVRYAQQAARAVQSGGYALISGFAPDGPDKCSGLPVARRSADDVAAIFAPEFVLLEQRAEVHVTPAGAEQSFAYALLRRT
jgi:ubiquinone/menaquinone biosynthesis C-methylase UbiE